MFRELSFNKKKLLLNHLLDFCVRPASTIPIVKNRFVFSSCCKFFIDMTSLDFLIYSVSSSK